MPKVVDPQNPSGIAHLCTFNGVLSILQEIFTVVMFITLLCLGSSTKILLLTVVTIIAFVITLIFVVLHMNNVMRTSRLPCYWIECVAMTTVAILLVVFSAVVITMLTTGEITVGVIGFITASVYFIDAFNKFQLAVTPTPKYAWTTPNMPELN